MVGPKKHRLGNLNFPQLSVGHLIFFNGVFPEGSIRDHNIYTRVQAVGKPCYVNRFLAFQIGFCVISQAKSDPSLHKDIPPGRCNDLRQHTNSASEGKVGVAEGGLLTRWVGRGSGGGVARGGLGEGSGSDLGPSRHRPIDPAALKGPRSLARCGRQSPYVLPVPTTPPQHRATSPVCLDTSPVRYQSPIFRNLIIHGWKYKNFRAASFIRQMAGKAENTLKFSLAKEANTRPL